MEITEKDIEGFATEVKEGVHKRVYSNLSFALDQLLWDRRFKTLSPTEKLELREKVLDHLNTEISERFKTGRVNLRNSVFAFGVKHRGEERTNWLQDLEDRHDEIHGSER